MMELTASTFIMFADQLQAGGPRDSYYYGDPKDSSYSTYSKDDRSESATAVEASVYVTAAMWEDCDTWVACNGANRIDPEPSREIPLHVLYREVGLTFDGLNEDSYYGRPGVKGNVFEKDAFIGLDTKAAFEKTSTAKFFFPDSKLVDGKTYFLTLEFTVEGAAAAFACYGSAYASTYAGAEVGPYIIDASIVTDADFGECGWLEPETEGCGLFDKLSGSADPDCEDDDSSRR
jgi:hypothetical protein